MVCTGRVEQVAIPSSCMAGWLQDHSITSSEDSYFILAAQVWYTIDESMYVSVHA